MGTTAYAIIATLCLLFIAAATFRGEASLWTYTLGLFWKTLPTTTVLTQPTRQVRPTQQLQMQRCKLWKQDSEETN